MESARAFADGIASAAKERGIAIDSAYMSFSPPNECDAELFYGKETTRRLKALKNKYDGENLFFKAYPQLI